MTQDQSTRAEAPDQLAGNSKQSEPAGAARAHPGAADEGRGEVSANTIARMMGLATAAELRLIEGKVDLVATKLNLLQVKIEKALTALGNVSTGADMERIDVQIGALRQVLREVASREAEKQGSTATVSNDGAKKPGANIQSNS